VRTRLGLAAVAVAALFAGCGPREEPSRTVRVGRGPIRMTVPFHGELEARRVERIASGVQGAAVLAELVAEGTRVEAGDVLARFDSSQIEQDLARQESEWVRARQELESLEKAELPLEWLDLQTKLVDLVAEREAEERFLETAQELRDRGLLSEGEVVQQERKILTLQARAEQMEMRLALTREHVHAARLAKARAALEAARRQRDFTARQLERCEVRAPAAGVATLLPLAVGGDYRTAHVGDTLFHNQVFLCIPDPTDHVVRGFAGEADLPQVRVGRRVEAVPAAFPDVRLAGRVETVGGMAQTRPGHPSWRKFFPVQIALEPLAQPLPVGISIRAEILAGETADALRIPREAAEWRGGSAYARRRTAGGAWEEAALGIGLSDAVWLEVESGLAEGDVVRLP
jgi:multidrug efflux pump subunit AcrA (membrane-fusion protein)